MGILLSSLPVETLLKVAGYLAEDILRLEGTCRHFQKLCQPAIRSYFQSRTHMFSRDGLQALLHMSQHEKFKSVVHRVAITTEHLQMPSADNSDKYKQYYQDQTRFLQSEDALATFTQILQNLKECDTIALELDGAWGTISLQEDVGPFLTSGLESEEHEIFVTEVANTIFQAITRAGVSPKILDLSWVALPYPYMLEALNLPSNEVWMSKVTELKVRLHIDDYEEDMDRSKPFAEFIAPFKALQSFYLSFDPSDNPYQLNQFSTVINFRGLQQFTVHHAECAPEDLKDVLHSHVETLREIKLQEVCFKKSLYSWSSIIQEGSRITTLEFEECYIDEYLVEFQLGNRQGPSKAIRVSCNDSQSLCRTLKQLNWKLTTPPSNLSL